jgi:hypothetical protein
MKRRNALVGLGMLAAGAGVISGTGAFTSVTAARSIEVTTAGDASANLRMVPLNTPNGNEYADDSGGTLSITVPDVNLNAVTHIDDVFRVTNNGGQPIVVYFEEQGGTNTAAVDLGAKLDQGFGVSSVGGNDQPTSDGIADENIIDISNPSPPGYNNIGVLLGAGTSLDVGVYIDTSDANLNDELGESSSADIESGDTLLDGIVVHASATAASNTNYYVERT